MSTTPVVLPNLSSSPSSKLSNFKDMYDAVKNQNEIMEVEITRLNNLYSTSGREALFTEPKYQWYRYVNFILWFLYFIVAFIAIYHIYFNNNLKMSFSSKNLLCVAFLIFPMVVLTLELVIYRMVMYLFSLFSGIPYKPEKNDKPPFSLLDIMPPGYY